MNDERLYYHSAIRKAIVRLKGVEPLTSISTEVGERSEANFFVEMRIPPKGGTWMFLVSCA